MIKRGGEVGLTGEPLPEVGLAGQLGGDRLDRHRPPKAELDGAIDDAHAAAAGDLLQSAPRKRRARCQIRHLALYTGATGRLSATHLTRARALPGDAGAGATVRPVAE